MSGRSDRRGARALRAGALALLASAAQVPPAVADEGGWLDFLSDLLERPEGAPLEVPLRKRGREVAPPPSETGPDSPVEPPPPETVVDTLAAPSPAVNPPQPPPAAALPARDEGAGLAQVARAIDDLVAEIHILREATGAADAPPEAEALEDIAPVHLHVKTLEVWSKVAQAQRRLGLPSDAVGLVPSRAFDAPGILVNIEHVLGELRRIKAHAGVERAIVPATLEPATSPSVVHKRLGDASFLLDALRGGPLGPADVHRHALGALDEVVRIAAKLGVAAGTELRPVQGPKAPVDVAQQLLRAVYKAVNLQTRLGMDASRVPAIDLVHATASQNYDMVNLLLAELARIKRHLGVGEMRAHRPGPPAGDGGLGDAFAVVQRLIANLDTLSATVSD